MGDDIFLIVNYIFTVTAWEVMGFGDLMGTQDAQLDQSEADWEQRKAEAQLLREQTAAQQQQPQIKTDNGKILRCLHIFTHLIIHMSYM